MVAARPQFFLCMGRGVCVGRERDVNFHDRSSVGFSCISKGVEVLGKSRQQRTGWPLFFISEIHVLWHCMVTAELGEGGATS
jgi:hypothetical protein